MPKKKTILTKPQKERAFLVGVEVQNEPSILGMEDSLEELYLLSETAGLNVVGETTQKLAHPDPGTYVRSGKLSEIIALVEETLAEIVVFDNELSPRHQRELEKALGLNVRVLDRTALILDIFAQHANTSEGKLQVELAQYEYRLPRLTRAWTHLARQAGGASGRSGSTGGVGLRGPGETQLEVDRREIRRRISFLKNELEKVRQHRERHRSNRKKSQIPLISLVGYTNAGKSTLLNQISNANVLVADKLFATLDPTTRRVELPGGDPVLITDTVGFIQKLPTQLVASFRATLEEITESDVLLHVLDITHPNVLNHFESVQNTLKEIGADQISVITVLNKMDLLPDPEAAREILNHFSNSVAISALKGTDIEDLLETIKTNLYKNFVRANVELSYKNSDLISLYHNYGNVEKAEHVRGGMIIKGTIPGRFVTKFKPYFISEDKPADDNQIFEIS